MVIFYLQQVYNLGRSDFRLNNMVVGNYFIFFLIFGYIKKEKKLI